MNPNPTSSGWLAESTTDDDLLLDGQLSELEVEDLLGCDVDFDEQDDWRAIDL